MVKLMNRQMMKEYFWCMKNDDGEYVLLDTLATGDVLVSVFREVVKALLKAHPEAKDNLYLLVDGLAIRIF